MAQLEVKKDDKEGENVKKEENDKNDKKEEKNDKKEEKFPELDLVFCMDCTGSMSDYIKKGKECIIDIVERIKSSEKADVQFSYIAYRDHQQCEEFCTKVYEFTSSLQKMRSYINNHNADGGGDAPEAVTSALHEALNLSFRKAAVKIVVIILDAPPHGVSTVADDYPNGDPNGYDPINIARGMAEKGIILYVVACEPSLSGYPLAHDFMAGLAKITQGRYLPLTSAHLLPDVIVGGAKEEILLQKLEEDAVKEMAKLKNDNPDVAEDALAEKLADSWAKEGKVINEGEIDDIYGAYDESNINDMAENMKDLKEFKKQAKILKQPEMKNFAAHGGHGGLDAYDDAYNDAYEEKKKPIFNEQALESLNMDMDINMQMLDQNEQKQFEIQTKDKEEEIQVKAQSYAMSEKPVGKAHVSKLLNRAKNKKG